MTGVTKKQVDLVESKMYQSLSLNSNDLEFFPMLVMNS